MHVLVLGGSGRTGQPLIAQALARGDSVTALVRKASSIAAQAKLTVIEGLPTDPTAVGAAMTTPRTPDAVLIALASPAQNLRLFFSGPPEPRYLMTDTFKVVADAMEAHGVKKVVVLSAQGVGESWHHVSWLVKTVFSVTSMKYAFEDHNLVEEEVRRHAGGLDWVIVKPARLVDGEKTHVRTTGEDGAGLSSLATISRQDVAAFMLDAAAEDAWVGKTPVISN